MGQSLLFAALHFSQHQPISFSMHHLAAQNSQPFLAFFASSNDFVQASHLPSLAHVSQRAAAMTLAMFAHFEHCELLSSFLSSAITGALKATMRASIATTAITPSLIRPTILTSVGLPVSGGALKKELGRALRKRTPSGPPLFGAHSTPGGDSPELEWAQDSTTPGAASQMKAIVGTTG